MNPHALRHWILSPARLPFRHSRAKQNLREWRDCLKAHAMLLFTIRFARRFFRARERCAEFLGFRAIECGASRSWFGRCGEFYGGFSRGNPIRDFIQIETPDPADFKARQRPIFQQSIDSYAMDA